MVRTRKTLPPILCKPDDLINIKRAVDVTSRSEKTIRRYFIKYALGQQAGPGAPIWLSLPGLMMVVHGDLEALEVLRAGDRNHPDVTRYLDMLGLPV